MNKKDIFFAKRADAFAPALQAKLTQMTKVSDITFGDKFVEGKPMTIDGRQVQAFGYAQKGTGREMIGFKVIEEPAKTEVR